MPLSTHAGAARLHTCSYLRHAPVRARCYSTVLSSMLIACARMLGVSSNQRRWPMITARLSQARDRSSKRARRTVGLRTCMHLISSSHVRMHKTDKLEPARPRSLQEACMDSLVRARASVRRAAGGRRWAHAPRPSRRERVAACGRKMHIACM
eukprot:5740050-Pleurochrysis_carterae.AAC.4